MRTVCGVLSVGLFLSGCAGAGYRLPEVDQASLKIVEKRMEREKMEPLEVYDRTEKQEKELVNAIATKLRKSAVPLCKQAKYVSCFFDVKYDKGDTINAFASEGYKITIYHGLIRFLKNNDEIATVIAHEMGHHLAHHNDEMLQNSQVGAATAGILTAVLLGAANANNPYYTPYQQMQDNRTVEDMTNAGAALGAISYSKEQEREADLLGAYLVSRAGYSLDDGRNLFFILANLPGQDADGEHASFMDTHPSNPERVVAWDKAVAEIKANRDKIPYIKETPTKSKSQF